METFIIKLTARSTDNFHRITNKELSRKDCIPFGAAAIRNKDSCIVLWVRNDECPIQFNPGRVGHRNRVRSGRRSKGIEIPRETTIDEWRERSVGSMGKHIIQII